MEIVERWIDGDCGRYLPDDDNTIHAVTKRLSLLLLLLVSGTYVSLKTHPRSVSPVIMLCLTHTSGWWWWWWCWRWWCDGAISLGMSGRPGYVGFLLLTPGSVKVEMA